MTQHATHGIPEWTLGDRLGKALEFAGISVSEMASYLEVSRNTIGNYINDRTRVPGASLILWAMRTGVPRDWLESGEVGPMPPGTGPGGPGNSSHMVTEG